MTPPVGRYRIEVDQPARRNLHRLPGKIASAIAEFITGPLADIPLRLSKPLHGELAAYRTARRGDYRILLRIDESRHALLVVAVDHRAHICRPR